MQMVGNTFSVYLISRDINNFTFSDRSHSDPKSTIKEK